MASFNISVYIPDEHIEVFIKNKTELVGSAREKIIEKINEIKGGSNAGKQD